jgi:nicotinate-nucleotide adenylyltransferase
VRIAIYGGTFDPVHCAHLTVAREAASALALDRVLFIPAAHPPHKSAGTAAPFADRLRMVELACEAGERLAVSGIEAGRGKSYSILTIEKLRREQPADEWFFLIGADAFAEIGSWYRWQDVLRAVEFIVVTRPGHGYDTPAGARVHRLDTLALPVSSSEIRRRLAAGESPRELDAKVLDYIRERGLYGVPPRLS